MQSCLKTDAAAHFSRVFDVMGECRRSRNRSRGVYILCAPLQDKFLQGEDSGDEGHDSRRSTPTSDSAAQGSIYSTDGGTCKSSRRASAQAMNTRNAKPPPLQVPSRENCSRRLESAPPAPPTQVVEQHRQTPQVEQQRQPLSFLQPLEPLRQPPMIHRVAGPAMSRQCRPHAKSQGLPAGLALSRVERPARQAQLWILLRSPAQMRIFHRFPQEICILQSPPINQSKGTCS